MEADRPDELLRVLGAYCHVNALGPDWRGHLRRSVRRWTDPDRQAAFEQQLADAIARRTLSRAQYEQATGIDFDTEAELVDELRALWGAVFGDTAPDASGAPADHPPR